MTEHKNSKRSLPVRRASGRHAGRDRRVFRDQSVICQRGLYTYIAATYHSVGNHKGMRLDLLVGRREGIQAAPQLVDLASLYPARKLPPYIVQVCFTGQQETSIKKRFVAGNLNQIFKIHTIKIPLTAS